MLHGMFSNYIRQEFDAAKLFLKIVTIYLIAKSHRLFCTVFHPFPLMEQVNKFSLPRILDSCHLSQQTRDLGLLMNGKLSSKLNVLFLSAPEQPQGPSHSPAAAFVKSRQTNSTSFIIVCSKFLRRHTAWRRSLPSPTCSTPREDFLRVLIRNVWNFLHWCPKIYISISLNILQGNSPAENKLHKATKRFWRSVCTFFWRKPTSRALTDWLVTLFRQGTASEWRNKILFAIHRRDRRANHQW